MSGAVHGEVGSVRFAQAMECGRGVGGERVPASASANGGYKTIHAFCKDLSLCPRGHSVFHEDQWFNVYCFAEASDAENFMKRFGGEKFSPKQRGRGSNWARWNK